MESETAPAATTSPEFTPEFTARRGAFASLLLTNGLLTLLTLGIYRFWARTRLRRFLWRHVRFMGDPLEYTGTAGELFLGFLIVLAVMFPLGALYGAIDVLAPSGVRAVGVTLELAYYAAIFVLLQIGFYRMWRYRMSRTLWRGVRFGLDGSSWQYLKLATGWTILTLCTLGLAYPWMKVDLWRYQVQHTRFGDTAFDFSGSGRALLPAWLGVIVPVAIVGGLMIHIGQTAAAALGDVQAFINNAPVLFYVAAGVSILMLPFTFLHYRVRQVRVCVAGMRFGPARFHSALSYWRVLASCAVTFGLVVAAMTPAVMWLEIASAGVPVDNVAGILSSAAVPIALLFLLTLLGVPLIVGAVFGFDMARQLVTSTTVDDAQAFEAATQRVSDAPRFGEGLADALDIGGF